MKNLEFTSKTAQKIYEQYLNRVNRSAKILSKDDRDDIMMEINSHIYEAISSKTGGEEADNLLSIIDGLGAPEEFLKPQIAEKKLKQATSTFNPVHVFQALLLNIRNGFAFIMVGMIYLFIFSFLFVFFAKIVSPEQVGMFFDEDGFVVLGMTSQIEATEVLGYWILPLLIIVMIALYFVNTFILKMISK